MSTMKHQPDAENEIHDLSRFSDGEPCQVTPVMALPPSAAQAVVEGLMAVVRQAHACPDATTMNDHGIKRAQTFEEGDVYMLAEPYEGYFADRYLMDFYDTAVRDICSRMHFHTGLRFVRMMTGVDTRIRVSSLSPFRVPVVKGVTPFMPHTFEDDLPDLPQGATARTRFNLVVPPCAWVDMQVPRGTSHQFNAIGPNAVIDSVHPEESIEVFRESMAGYRMMAQTIFLADRRPPSATCQL